MIGDHSAPWPDLGTLELGPGPNDALTDVPGVLVGHYSNPTVYRGTTAILTPGTAVAGVSVRGANPGTIGTDALAPINIGTIAHGVGLSGGSLFGLQAITGITSWLHDHGIGLQRRAVRIPIVPGAVIYDVDLADPSPEYLPTAEWGRRAAEAAAGGAFERGNVGAGRGATAGKGRGCVRVKGGLGTASLSLPNGVFVGAIAVVNAVGGVIDPFTGRLYACSGGFDRPQLFRGRGMIEGDPLGPIKNTTLGVIATNALLSKVQMTKVADLAHDGLARTIRPAHAMFDGDAIFALSVGTDDRVPEPEGSQPGDYTDLIGAAAADAMTRAIVDAVMRAEGVPGFPACREVLAED